jgi:hypothetical protein
VDVVKVLSDPIRSDPLSSLLLRKDKNVN